MPVLNLLRRTLPAVKRGIPSMLRSGYNFSAVTAVTTRGYQESGRNGRYAGGTGLSTLLILSLTNTSENTPPDNQAIISPSYSVFKAKVDKFCEDQGYQFSFKLPDSFYEQLSWLMYNEINSPELRNKLLETALNMEVQRSLSRLYCFDLLCRTDIAILKAYAQFICSQEGSPLSLDNFKLLRKQARLLNSDEREIIQISCILTKSNYGDNVLKLHGVQDVPVDSEEFLTWLSINRQALAHFPVGRHLTAKQQEMLQKIYIPLHGRAVPFTEGSLLMTQKAAGLNALWKMRWWTNLMGFKGHEGAGAKYLDEKRFEFFHDCYELLEKNKENPVAILQLWLDNIAKKSDLGKYGLCESEEKLIAHLLAFYGEYSTASKVTQVVAGYLNYKKQYLLECANLVENYNKFRRDNINTPTYTPAILHTATAVLEDLLKNTTNSTAVASPIATGVAYTMQILQQLYQLYQQDPPMRNVTVSGRDLAYLSTASKSVAEWVRSGGSHFQCRAKAPQYNLECDESVASTPTRK